MSASVGILGSEGQIGQYLVKFLEKQELSVKKIDIVRSPAEDLRNPQFDLSDFFRECDFVFFLAFDVGGSTYLEKYQDSFEFIENNVSIMRNVFVALRKTSTRFLFASSQMSSMSFSTYGLLKAIGEKWTSTMPFGKTVHFWNVYGYEKDPTKFHVISDFISMALQSRRINMRTDGQEVRDFLFADDCSEGLYTIYKEFDKIPRQALLHLASHKFVSIQEVADIVSHIIPSEVVLGSSSDNVQKMVTNEPDPFMLQFWEPRTSLKQGIEKIAKQVREDLDGS